MSTISPFLDPGPLTTPGALALVHLSRDNVVPVYLREGLGTVDGYSEGAVINTRFGSFPHSTLIGQPWGSQIRASVVDTGSRGRKKRKLGDVVATGSAAAAAAVDDATGNDTEAVTSSTSHTRDVVKTAATGFIHVLPPTPEIWTSSLPHRTQVVYTPDYSYILHRIRARPGAQIIEAGSGSGSFTHAAARAVYSGYPKGPGDKRGKVWSFEFNHNRFLKMREEVEDHRLSRIVQVTHRDVYHDGFLVHSDDNDDDASPEAECVFLDVPAPWQALPHLSRRKPAPSLLASGSLEPLNSKNETSGWKSPLRADRAVHICTFSPCIEQVTKTVETMRRLGWMDIEMVEVAQRRINVLREKVGLNMPLERGTNQSPRNVDEAITRLKRIDGRFKEFYRDKRDVDVSMEDVDAEDGSDKGQAANGNVNGVVKEDVNAADTNTNTSGASTLKPWMAGRLVHRTEAEIKTHTSYLVFAVLPQEWSEEQEAAAFEKWPCGKEKKVIGSLDKETRKQEKREMLLGNKQKKTAAKAEGSKAEGSSDLVERRAEQT